MSDGEGSYDVDSKFLPDERRVSVKLWDNRVSGLQTHEVGSDGGTVTSLGPIVGARGAYFNTVCMMLGVGVFGLPATIAKGGWVMMAVMPVLIAMACYTARLLIDLLYADHATDGVRLFGYPDIGGRIWGKPGLILTHFFMKITLLTVCSVMAYLSSQMSRDFYHTCKYGHNYAGHDSMSSLRHVMIIICGTAAIVLIALPAIKEVTWLSLGGSIATFVVIALTIGCALSDIPSDMPPYDDVVPSKLGDGFGTLTLGLGGAACMPSFEGQMYTGRRGAKPYKKVLLFVFGTLALIYMPMASVGYFVYGKDVKPLIIDALPQHGAFIWVLGAVRFTLALNCFVSLILGCFVLAEEMEKHTFGIDPTNLPIREHLFSRHSFPRAIGRLFILGCAFALAYSVPNFLALCDLTGSVCVFAVYILPGVYSLALDRERVAENMQSMGWPRRLLIVAIMIVALAGFYFGFRSALDEVRDAWS